MTTADQERPTEHLAVVQPSEYRSEPRPRRRWRWLWLVPAVGVMGLAFGLAVGALAPGLGTTPEGGVLGRPTIVFADRATPPSTPTAPVATEVPRPGAPAEDDEYAVEPGDTLRSIAAKVYGDPERWPRIYDANRDTIGPNPDTLRAGLHLRIPAD